MADLRVNHRLTIPAAELVERFARSGGPGGQHVNKTASKVELRWNPLTSRAVSEADRRLIVARMKLTSGGDLIVVSERTRDQARNRQDAREKLAAQLRTALGAHAGTCLRRARASRLPNDDADVAGLEA
jgi:ribosome-associated protein